MDEPGRLLRAARRQAGASQRAFAARSGIALRVLQDVESGARAPSWQTLQRAAAAAGLTVELVPEVAAPSDRVRRFLSLSTTDRFCLGLAQQDARGAEGAVGRALSALSWQGQVHVTGAAALPVWVPGAALPEPLPVRLHARAPVDLASDLLEVQVVPAPLPGRLVALRLRRSRVLWVDDPLALSLREDCGAHVQVLRQVVRCFDAEGPVDGAERRRPPHREPQERAEAAYLSHDARLDRWALPDAHDSRAWRLGGTVSLAQWLAEGRPETGTTALRPF